MKVKEESEQVGLKFNIQKTKIMASGPITSRQIDGETVETGSDFIFWVSKITADGDCSHEIKRCLLLGRKVMINLNSILKSKDMTLLTKVCLVKAMVFPVIVYGCESWTIKNAEHQRIDVFELWCYERLLRVSWIARRSNQSILKEISPGCSLEGVIWSWNSSPLATWCEELTYWERLCCWEGLGAGEKGTTEDKMAGWHRQLHRHGFGWTPGVGDGQGGLACCSSWGLQESDMTEWLNGTELIGAFLVAQLWRIHLPMHKMQVCPLVWFMIWTWTIAW